MPGALAGSGSGSSGLVLTVPGGGSGSGRELVGMLAAGDLVSLSGRVVPGRAGGSGLVVLMSGRW